MLDVDLDTLEQSLSEQERIEYQRLREGYDRDLDGVDDATAKAREAALLFIRMERASVKSARLLREGIESPEETDHTDVVGSLGDSVEATRQYREYLEEIGVYPE
jgi:hypothetical protein